MSGKTNAAGDGGGDGVGGGWLNEIGKHILEYLSIRLFLD